MKTEVYQQVTDRIVAMLESGTKPWQKSWAAGAPIITGAMQRPLRANGQPYKGVNVVNLWVASQMRGLTSRHWLTYKGAQELGGQVRKGARGEFAFYVGQSTRAAENENESDQTFSFLKCYHVFNASEIDGLPLRFTSTAAAPVDVPAAPVCPHARNAAVDAFFADAGVRLAHGGDRAFYMPSTDAVRMPELAQFNSAESYYATLAHEAVHWTGHVSRCARQFGTRFGDDAYAVEELVAELGSAFLLADLGLSDSPRADHADYLASWLKVLKADCKAIFTAASAADRAASFLHAAQPSVALAA